MTELPPASLLPIAKPLYWVGGSRRDIKGLPDDVRDVFGQALRVAQLGGKHEAAKPLQGFGGAGVLEIIEDAADGAYRAVYTVKLAGMVFVLHCFQQEEQTWHRHAQRGHGHHSRQAEGGQGAGKGAYG
jgi:phage-related protein